MKAREGKISKWLDRIHKDFALHLRIHLNELATQTGIHPKDLDIFLRNVIEHKNFYKKLVKLVDRVFCASIIEMKLNRAQQQDFAKRVRVIDCVNEALEAIIETIRNNPDIVKQKNYFHTLGLEFLLPELEAKLRYIIIDKYEIIDQRVIEDDSLPVRRMNSLARIFRLTDQRAVCNSVAIYDGELILSFNMSDNQSHELMKGIVTRRVQVLEEHLRKVQGMSMEEYHECYKELNAATYRALCAVHPCSFGEDLIMQALDKLSDSIFFNDTALSHDVRRVFLAGRLKFTILLPLVENQNQLSIMCNDQVIKTDFNIASVTFAHTEQVLAYYLLKIRGVKPQEKFPIGITKLCCQSCHHNLADLPVAVLGAHGEMDPLTLSFFGKKLLEAPGTPKRGPTAPPRSPDSAVKRREGFFNRGTGKRPTFDLDRVEDDQDGLPDYNDGETKRHNKHDDDDWQYGM